MDLKYEILLFEDDSDYVIAIKDLLEDYLDDLGFKLVLNVDEGDKFDELIIKDDWDLILMDFNLKSFIKGDELIRRIRDNEFYTEIIFYSEDTKFDRDIRSEFIDGVFFARGRDALREKVKKVIKLTLKKNQDVNNMRGLVIAEAIDLVELMDEIILRHLHIIDDKTDFFKDKILEQEFFTDFQKTRLIKKILAEEISSIKTKIEGAEVGEDLSKLEQNKKDVEKLRDNFSKIVKEIVEIRNQVAHSKPSNDKKNTLVCRIDGKKTSVEFDEEECISIRKNFMKHAVNLNKIVERLNN